ncbi:hypothetical protein ACFZBU_42530 [Embleya sp. NPDC008237]|uniref:hypothetical protein n=1 Tax=Embleya sp. NPDC008237 TaxID=3363978 RepID=UPI0036EADE0D
MSLVLQSVAASPGDGSDPEAAAAGTVLVYEPTTLPDPVRVSPAEGAVERANLVFVGSRHLGSGIEANKLTAYIPTGTASAELALDLTGITAQTSLPGWTATSDPAGQRIVFAPPSGVATIEPGQGLTIQLDGIRINRVVGSAPVILELSYRTVGTSAWKTDRTTFGIGKFPADFYLRELTAEPRVVGNGGTVKLTWEASAGATYKLLYGGAAEIDVTAVRTYDVPNVRASTMFYLRGTTQSGNNPVERTLSTGVTVDEPDLVVRTLTVRDTITADGAVTVGGTLTGNGPVDLFRGGQSLRYMPGKNYTFTAPTSGFLMGKITTVGSVSSSTLTLRTVLGEETHIAQVHAAAAGADGSNTASLPVVKGTECAYWVKIREGGISPSFRWVPLGEAGRVTPSEHWGTPTTEESTKADTPQEELAE